MLKIAAIAALFFSAISVQANGSVPTYQLKEFVSNTTSHFGGHIEGASVDQFGNVYAVSYNADPAPSVQPSFGRFFPSQELVYTDKDNTTFFNGIAFLRYTKGKRNYRNGYAVDANNKRIVKFTIAPNGKFYGDTFCSHPNMTAPNDVIIDCSGRAFISQQIYNQFGAVGDGGVWYCDGTSKLATEIWVGGRTNGIELTPDEKSLLVSEAFNGSPPPWGYTPISNNLLKFDIKETPSGIPELINKRVLVNFTTVPGENAVNPADIDGTKVDIGGNIYITRNGAGNIKKFSPTGKYLAEYIPTSGGPSSVALGGPKGTTLFAVGGCKDSNGIGCVSSIEVPLPGRAWAQLHDHSLCRAVKRGKNKKY